VNSRSMEHLYLLYLLYVLVAVLYVLAWHMHICSYWNFEGLWSVAEPSAGWSSWVWERYLLSSLTTSVFLNHWQPACFLYLLMLTDSYLTWFLQIWCSACCNWSSGTGFSVSSSPCCNQSNAVLSGLVKSLVYPILLVTWLMGHDAMHYFESNP
jgi:hypothetical protein